MTLRELVNKAITTTGVAHAIDTVNNHDPDTDIAKIIGFARDSQLDVSRAIPNAPLWFDGAITSVARINMQDHLATTTEGDIQVTNGSSTVDSADAGNALTPLAAWVGRLIHIVEDAETYRVFSVDLGNETVTLADMAGNEINYLGTTRTGVTAYIAQDRYILPENFKLPNTFHQFWGPGVMEWLSPQEFDRFRFEAAGLIFKVEDPSHFSIKSVQITAGQARYMVEFYPIPLNIRTFPFRYEGSPTLMEADNDVSGYPAEYEAAILFRLRYYIYRFIMKSTEDAGIELQEYRLIVDDQRKNPVAAVEVARIVPETSRDHWNAAFES